MTGIPRTFEGRACKRCASTVRYQCNGSCVNCSRLRAMGLKPVSERVELVAVAVNDPTMSDGGKKFSLQQVDGRDMVRKVGCTACDLNGTRACVEWGSRLCMDETGCEPLGVWKKVGA